MRKHVKKRHKDIRVAELSNGKSSQTCCLHPLNFLEMGHCNCVVIRRNSVYLNLGYIFFSICGSLKTAVSVSHCKKTIKKWSKSSTETPRKSILGATYIISECFLTSGCCKWYFM